MQEHRPHSFFNHFASALIVVLTILPSMGLGQQTVTIMKDGQPVQIELNADGAVPAELANALTTPESGNQNKNDESKKGKKSDGDKKNKDGKDDKEKKDKEDDKGGKAEESGDSIKRPKAPPRVPDPREFDVKPDKNARLKFNFHGQPWPDVLQWYATISGKSLDWQELPNDYINFSTDRPYSLTETKNLFNRMLFERGYTMLISGDVILVNKIESLDPSLLPRVEDESMLLDLSPHDFVKITFQLPRQLKADQAATEVKPLLTKHAKVQPLLATNRLLVVDLVGNLRDVSRLINAEHAAANSLEVPKEFVIKHARASEVADKVMVLLGLDPSTRLTSSELKIETQRLQLYSKLQSKGKDITKYLGKGKAQLFLTVNHRNNTILVNAAPNELDIIEKAIKMLDVPKGFAAGTDNATQTTVKKYPLNVANPEIVLSALEQLTDLDPRSQLKVDESSKIIVAKATAADHVTIAALVKELDEEKREFDVIWLRRLPADSVAKTIQKLMVGDEEDESSSRRRRYSYWYDDNNDDKEDDKFSVDADVENNRLLLYANKEEMGKVRGFLAKLGEIPGQSGNPNTIRVLDARGVEPTRQLLRQLQEMWPTIGSNPLIIRQEEPLVTPKEPETDDGEARNNSSKNNLIQFVGFPVAEEGAESESADADNDVSRTPGKAGDLARVRPIPATDEKPIPTADLPVTVSLSADGRIVISSKDTRALDMIEALVEQIAPRPENFKVFYLKYALAMLVTTNLEEYFEDEGDVDTDDIYWRGWYGYDYDDNKKDKGTGLGKRRKIRFIYDFDTNSVLVSNASPEQLETIEKLIEIYDQPPGEESLSARRFRKFKLKHAKADDVAKTIKEVYRDLLSAKDSAFKDKKQKEQSSNFGGYIRVYGGSKDDKDKKGTKVKASFAGALSMGIDSVSNTLIVSAQEEWMNSIAEMIEFLDQEAKPYVPAVQVVNTNIDARIIQEALARAFGSSGSGGGKKKNKKNDNPPATPPNVEAQAVENN
ncbi:MAG: secretin N-terminal domain-containing protein [Planctomycetota bacterium]